MRSGSNKVGIELAVINDMSEEQRASQQMISMLSEQPDNEIVAEDEDNADQQLTGRALQDYGRLETEAPLMTERIIDEQEIVDCRIDFDASPNMASPQSSSKKQSSGEILKQSPNKGSNYLTKQKDSVKIVRAPSMRDIFSQRYAADNQFNGSQTASGLLSTFKYTEPSKAKCNLIFGLMVATINGALGATHAYILAELIESFNRYQNDRDVSEHLKDTLFKLALPFSVAMLVFGYIQSIMMSKASNQLQTAMRAALVKSLLT